MKNIVISAFALFMVSGFLPSIAQAQDSSDYKDLVSKKDGEYYAEGALKIDIVKAYELHGAGMLFIDVNTPSGYEAGHIPGAVALDVEAMTEPGLAEHAAKDQTFVFYCPHPGCWGAAVASAKAIVWGYTNILYYEGGADSWAEAGHAIDKG
jgi:rhodanese-related sulfurtransferase